MNNVQRPVIGLLAAQMQSELDLLDKVATSYTESVYRAGGLPLILPNIPDAVSLYLPGLDGLLLIGGTQDIDPAVYGEQNSASRHTNIEKDRLEMQLLERTLSAGLPVLGICRGMQIINVLRGGTLRQDIVSELPHNDYARQNETVHELAVEGSAHLSAGRHRVNSIHHQAVGRLGSGLVATGRAPDGVIEMIESPGRFLVGVQWHPECLPDEQSSRQLFEGLIRAVKIR